MSEELTRRGLDVFAQLMGEDTRAAMEQQAASGGSTGDMAKLACQFAFASVWDRDGLDRKQRSLVTIGVLVAQRQTLELKNHIRIALTNGLSQREIEEALIQTVPYAGFPAAAAANSACIEVMRELGVDTTTKTSEESGLR